MLTPQEVSERAFAKASFGGYNMAMVDEFLDVLTADYTALYKENATLKAKMKILAEKLEEYRSTEDAMRKTLLTAQRMADDIVAEAESQKADMLKNVETNARARMEELARDILAEQGRLAAAKAATAEYVDKLKEMYLHEVDYLHTLSSMTAPPAAPVAPAAPAPDPVAEAAGDISAAVDRLTAEEPPAVSTPAPEAPAAPASVGVDSLYAELLELTGDPAVAPDGDEDVTAPTRRIDFEHLEFGKDYEIR